MHCHYNISTWKARDPQISRHWTKTLEIPVSLMMERWTENTTWNMWEAPDRRQISVSSVPSVFEFAFFKNTKYHRPRSQSSICRDREIKREREPHNHRTMYSKPCRRLTNVLVSAFLLMLPSHRRKLIGPRCDKGSITGELRLRWADCRKYET